MFTNTCILENFVYYGQTDRALATRIKEHSRAVRVGDNNSKIAQHANQFSHSIDFDQATIVDKARDYHKRLFLEAWHSLRDRNMWAMNILMFREFIAHSRDLFSRAVIVRYAS